MTSAREEVLARIAAAHRTAPPTDLDYASISRDYRADDAGHDRSTDEATHEQLVERLVERLTDYKALVRRADRDQVATVVARALAERGVGRLVLPAGLDETWLAGVAGVAGVVGVDGAGGDRVELLRDTAEAPLGVADLDGADGVITGCAVAVAETGTLILDAGPGQGRRALTLVPDYHLCVVWPDALCAGVPQAVGRLDLSRPVTMISGPSATSDIELNRVEGVHGPRTLEVIIVG